MMPVKRLLKSWAMPPVSWPTASIFCDWRRASSACLRSAIASATRASSVSLMRCMASSARADQILMTLQELRGNPATPANVAAALGKMNELFVDRFGKELKLVKDGAATGKYEHDVDVVIAVLNTA